jgi:hypothetical protein
LAIEKHHFLGIPSIELFSYSDIVLLKCVFIVSTRWGLVHTTYLVSFNTEELFIDKGRNF